MPFFMFLSTALKQNTLITYFINVMLRKCIKLPITLEVLSSFFFFQIFGVKGALLERQGLDMVKNHLMFLPLLAVNLRFHGSGPTSLTLDYILGCIHKAVLEFYHHPKLIAKFKPRAFPVYFITSICIFICFLIKATWTWSNKTWVVWLLKA